MPTEQNPTSGPLRVVVARSLAELEPHRQAWNALAAQAPQQLPMVSHAWTSTYFEHMCPPGARWATLLAYRGEELAAVLPLVEIVRRQFGISLHVLTTPRDDHTQIGDLLARDNEPEAAAALIAHARREFPRASYLEINRFSESSVLLKWLRDRRLPGTCEFRLDSYGAYLPVPADYAEFRRNLSKNFRSNLNKATNKVAQLKDVSYRIERGPDARPEDLKHLMEVEASGWKGQQGSAIAASPRLVSFYSSLVQRLAEAGWLEWQFMHGDGRVLAGNLAIRLPRSVILWKLGYLDEYSRCSPGSMLMEEVLKRASAERSPDVVDLTTDLPWYDNWGMTRKPFYTARVYFGLKGHVFGYLPDTTRTRLKRVGWIVALKESLDRRRKGK